MMEESVNQSLEFNTLLFSRLKYSCSSPFDFVIRMLLSTLTSKFSLCNRNSISDYLYQYQFYIYILSHSLAKSNRRVSNFSNFQKVKLEIFSYRAISCVYEQNVIPYTILAYQAFKAHKKLEIRLTPFKNLEGKNLQAIRIKSA